jgi:hypothetical protein
MELKGSAKKADTYPSLLRQVSSQSEHNSGCSGHSKVVACPPPGIGAKKVQQSSETNFGITYRAGSVALKSGVVDLHICTILSINRSALKVACPPPGVVANN